MRALMLAASLLQTTDADTGAMCQRTPCGSECWTTHVLYEAVNSQPGQPVAYLTREILVGGLWGQRAEAECFADQVAREGVWLDPILGARKKVPPAAVKQITVYDVVR